MIPSLGPHADDGNARVEQALQHGLILIVDESRPIRLKLVEILEKQGTPAARILQASGPDEALELFRKARPTVVFTELVGVHPEDGLEIIHEMLDHDSGARVILVTSEPRDGPEVRAAMRAGVFGIVEKPLRHEKIRAVLADLEAEAGGIERYR